MREFTLSLIGCVGALAFSAPAVASPRDDVLAAVVSWSRAIVANDLSAVGQFVADDWMLIDADGAVITKASFIGIMASGELMHDGMTLGSPVVRLYGDVAIVSGVATSTGAYRGQRFATHERSTDVFVWRNGRLLKSGESVVREALCAGALAGQELCVTAESIPHESQERHRVAGRLPLHVPMVPTNTRNPLAGSKLYIETSFEP